MVEVLLIDACVYLERRRGRRIFLDYRENPGEGEIDFSKLGKEAFDYLSQAGACFGRPIDRLRHMNLPAVEFYQSRGVDLEQEPLEIALCAQHNNGVASCRCLVADQYQRSFCGWERSAEHMAYTGQEEAL